MKTQFDWSQDDDDGRVEWMARGEAGSRPDRRKRWIRVGVAVALVAALALVVARWLQQQESAEAGAVESVAWLEDQALARGDRQVIQALQDPALGSTPLATITATAALWDKLSSGTVITRQVTFDGGFARLNEGTIFQVKPSGDPPLPTAEVRFVVSRFYRQADNGWLQTLPGAAYWGDTRQWTGKHVSIRYAQRDATAVLPWAPTLDDLIARACGDWNCPSALRPVITFSPTLQALQSADGGPSGVLASPSLLAMPANPAAQQLLLRVYGPRVLDNVAFAVVGQKSAVQNSPEFQALVAREVGRLGLAAMPQYAAAGRGLQQSGNWRPLAADWQKIGDEAAAAQARSLVEEIGQRYGIAGEGQLLAGLGASEPLTATLASRFQTDPDTFESQWWSDVAQGNAGSPPPWPSGPFPGDLGLVCGTDLRVIGQGQQGAESVLIASWDGFGIRADLSPDGRWFAVIDGGFGGNGRLSVVDTRTGQIVQVAQSTQRMQFRGWSADGTWLAYSSGPAFGFPGSTRTVLQRVGEQEKLELPGIITWAPDRTAGGWDYVRYTGDGHVYVGDVSGRQQDLGTGTQPAWSADGRLAVLTTGPAGGNEMDIVDPATGDRTLLITLADVPPLPDGQKIQSLTSPAWSPDGTTLALLGYDRSYRPQQIALIRVVLAVRQPQILAVHNRPGTLSWSPDGRWLAFSESAFGGNGFGFGGGNGGTLGGTASGYIFSNGGTGAAGGSGNRAPFINASSASHIEVVAADGHQRWQIRFSIRGSMAWSPDGQWLAVDQSPNSTALFAADGHAMRRLPGSCSQPTWRAGETSSPTFK